MRLRIMDLPLDIADVSRFALIFDEVAAGELDEETAVKFARDMQASAVLILPGRVDIEPMTPLYGASVPAAPRAVSRLVTRLRAAASRLSSAP